MSLVLTNCFLAQNQSLYSMYLLYFFHMHVQELAQPLYLCIDSVYCA